MKIDILKIIIYALIKIRGATKEGPWGLYKEGPFMCDDLASGKCQVASGKWQVASGKWQVAQVASIKWLVASG